MSHSFVLHHSFTGLLVDYDNDPSAGGERMERLREINYHSLGFHVILHIRETSSVGQTHSCILDKVEGTSQNKLPQFRILRGSKPTDWLKMASTSQTIPNANNECEYSKRNLLRHTMMRYALIASVIAWVG